MDNKMKAFDFFWELYNKDLHFQQVVKENMGKGKIRFFDETEWDKIRSQNFISPTPEMKEFMDLFLLGYNRGDCVHACRQLSYSYNNVSIVSGILPLLKGTLNAENEGGHCWLETNDTIIDTSLMLVIDKSLKDEIGYIEEQRLTPFDLAMSPRYQARKEFVNDRNIKSSKKM